MKKPSLNKNGASKPAAMSTEKKTKVTSKPSKRSGK